MSCTPAPTTLVDLGIEPTAAEAILPDLPRPLPAIRQLNQGGQQGTRYFASFDRLLPTAMLIGGGYLLLVDTLARTMARIEVPIGILTAVIGAPFFLWLLARGREGWS